MAALLSLGWLFQGGGGESGAVTPEPAAVSEHREGPQVQGETPEGDRAVAPAEKEPAEPGPAQRSFTKVLTEFFGEEWAGIRSRLEDEYPEGWFDQEVHARFPTWEEARSGIEALFTGAGEPYEVYRSRELRQERRDYLLTDPDIESSKRLNPDGLPLTEEQEAAVSDFDQLYRESLDEQLVTWWDTRQAAIEDAVEKGHYTYFPLLSPTREWARPGPWAGARTMYNKAISASGGWCARLDIYEGEYPELDEAYRRLVELKQERGRAVADYIRSLQ